MNEIGICKSIGLYRHFRLQPLLAICLAGYHRSFFPIHGSYGRLSPLQRLTFRQSR